MPFDKTSYINFFHRPFMGGESLATNKGLWHNVHYHNASCGGVPFSGYEFCGGCLRVRPQKAEGFGRIVARALAYGKSVGFIMLRKIREP